MTVKKQVMPFNDKKCCFNYKKLEVATHLD